MEVDTKVRCDRCGAEVSPDLALGTEHDGLVYYFCSVRCQESKDYTPGRDEAPEEEEGAEAGD